MMVLGGDALPGSVDGEAADDDPLILDVARGGYKDCEGSHCDCEERGGEVEKSVFTLGVVVGDEALRPCLGSAEGCEAVGWIAGEGER